MTAITLHFPQETNCHYTTSTHYCHRHEITS